MEDYLLQDKIKKDVQSNLDSTSSPRDVFISPALYQQPPLQEEFEEEGAKEGSPGGALEDLQDELEDSEIDSDSLRESLEDLPEEPAFPILLFIFAIIVDVTQLLATFTVVLAIFTPILGVLFSIFSFFYFFGKINFIQKYITRKLLNKFLLTFFVEFIPGLNVVPTATIFTFLAYKSQSKIIAAYLKAAESLGKAEGL